MNTTFFRGRFSRPAAAIGAAALITLGGAVSATSAQAATYRGGVDMQRACNDQYGAAYGYVAKVMNPNDAYSWRCTKPWDTTRQIDVNRACAIQYPGAWQGLQNRYNPYSWFCQS